MIRILSKAASTPKRTELRRPRSFPSSSQLSPNSSHRHPIHSRYAGSSRSDSSPTNTRQYTTSKYRCLGGYGGYGGYTPGNEAYDNISNQQQGRKTTQHLTKRNNIFPPLASQISSFSSWSSTDPKMSWNSKTHPNKNNNNKNRSKSTATQTESPEYQRLQSLRNVGILAHVDAGKTTVTERMLALAGIVHRVGSVDEGNTVTDYLPAERERGITIQSAAISFNWKMKNNTNEVNIHLIDTPGHVDFSVEVNRSVAVLDGAVLVVDAVAGVQAQTETVWRAMTKPSWNNHSMLQQQEEDMKKVECYRHEPLPCIAMINKMDKEGCNFGQALNSLRYKLQGANPVAIQIPLFRVGQEHPIKEQEKQLAQNILAIPVNESQDKASSLQTNSHFVGVIDLLQMRAIVWPDTSSASVSDVESCIPTVYNLLKKQTGEPNTAHIDPESQVFQVAKEARQDLIAALADVDEEMEEYFLMEEDPANVDLLAALRRSTVNRKVMPVLAGAVLRGKGVEPLLDAVAELLPSPQDRLPPALIEIDNYDDRDRKNSKNHKKKGANTKDKIKLGHPHHPSLLALAFKVVHMKNRGGSGDGRVVFARVYSGKLSSRDTLKVITPNIPGEKAEKPRTERVGGMLELAGGRFNNLKDAVCYSGDVCALVGLKSVVTGDTLMLASDHSGSNKKKKKQANHISSGDFDLDVGNVCLAGVASPKPVLTVKVEAESAEEQAKLTKALELLCAEDPSLHVEETGSTTLLSGLGELHIEVVVDRLQREHGLSVWIGKPSVSYRETVQDVIETDGLVNYDRTIGAMRMQGSVHIRLEPMVCAETVKKMDSSSCMLLSDPVVTIGEKPRIFLGLDVDTLEDELARKNDIIHALISGCQGALKRGALGSYEMANVHCHVVDIDSEGGVAALNALPGSMRAAASAAVSSLLNDNASSCSILEPSMSLEITVPGEMVGNVLSDLTTRRGTVGDVIVGDDAEHDNPVYAKALIHGEVPLAEILGYANSLRSLTGGEGAFSAEYKGHTPCEQSII